MSRQIRLCLSCIFGAMAPISTAHADEPAPTAHFSAGYRQFKWTDEFRARPVWADVWYPANPATPESPIVYGLGRGTASRDATIAEGRFPIVLLSHGAGGSARDYPWIGEYLARGGFVVLGVSHFGESWVYGPETIDPVAVTRLWLRPKDCSFALDKLLVHPDFADHVDPAKIAALGHSSGGATVIMLAGAIFDATSLRAYCASGDSTGDHGCDYAKTLTLDTPPEASASYSDKRIKVIVALDPAAGPGFSDESLAKVAVSTLIVGAVENDFLPFEHHASRIAKRIPNASLIELANGEGHFVYLASCTAPIEANGIPLCKDRDGVDREAVHAMLAPKIASFLKSALANDTNQ